MSSLTKYESDCLNTSIVLPSSERKGPVYFSFSDHVHRTSKKWPQRTSIIEYYCTQVLDGCESDVAKVTGHKRLKTFQAFVTQVSANASSL